MECSVGALCARGGSSVQMTTKPRPHLDPDSCSSTAKYGTSEGGSGSETKRVSSKKDKRSTHSLLSRTPPHTTHVRPEDLRFILRDVAGSRHHHVRGKNGFFERIVKDCKEYSEAEFNGLKIPSAALFTINCAL
jgi:hypothetical protein